MASKISLMDAATALDTDDLFEVVEDGNTRKATLAQVFSAGLQNAAVPITWSAQTIPADPDSNGDGSIGTTTGNGLFLNGQGSSNDLILGNRDQSVVLNIPTGTTYVGIGNSTNANMTTGLTINQGGADNEILALKSSDVAHGITSITETDTYGYFAKNSAAEGSLIVRGFTSGTRGIMLNGVHTTDNSTRSTSASACLTINAQLKSGTAVAALGADTNILTIATGGTVRFIFDSDGDSHQDVGVAWTNFDFANDIEVMDAMAVVLHKGTDPLRVAFVKSLEDARAVIERLPGKPIIAFNEDGHHFANMSRVTMLHHGAIRQQAAEIAALKAQLLLLQAP